MRNKNSAKVIGTMFLLGFSGIVTARIANPILESENYLELISQNQSLMQLSVLFYLIMAIACINIGIWFYPVLKKHNTTLAFGAALFRLVEGMLYFFGIILTVTLINLSKDYTNNNSIYIGNLLLMLRSNTNQIFILLTWCIGAAMHYIVLHKSSLVPKWLTIWGLIGVTTCITTSILVLFQVIKPMSSIQIIFNIPIGIQELALAIWLLTKGFKENER